MLVSYLSTLRAINKENRWSGEMAEMAQWTRVFANKPDDPSDPQYHIVKRELTLVSNPQHSHCGKCFFDSI